MVKYIAWIIAVLGLAWLFFSSCDDYLETGIEGQWQMTKIIKADGTEQAVDTVFYKFKKDVFQYQILLNDLAPYSEYGNFKESGDKLTIKIKDTVCLFGTCEPGTGEETEEPVFVEWVFTVKKHTSNKLELQFDDELLLFRKY